MKNLSSPPVVIVEEHHEAYYVWKWAIEHQIIQPEHNTLLHIDEHSDMSSPFLKTSIHSINGNLKKRKKFTYDELNIASFIVPAIYERLFDKVYWVRQRHNKTTPVPEELYVRSYQDEGKRLVSGRVSVLKDFGGDQAVDEQQAICYQFFKLHVEDLMHLDHVLLDIDLDYFSCVQDPLKRELKIEITKEEYERFQETPYHRMRYFDLGRVEVRARAGRYYYYLNSFNTPYESPLKVDEATILKRMDFAFRELERIQLSPRLITICRSRFSGYTPDDQWRLIEEHVLKHLNNLYGDLKPVHISAL